MKRLIFAAALLALAVAAPVPATAGVGISISIPLPPPIIFPAPPAVIVLPDTDDVYVVPDVDAEIFFWDGWWWYLWEGRWYRSRYYDRGWVYYRYVPRFYFDVDPGWRRYYRDRDWHGHRWDYEPIPYPRFHKEWKGWRGSRHWERQRNWDVEGYRAHPREHRRELRRQREEQYLQRPEVRRHRQEMREQRRQPRVRQPERRAPEGRERGHGHEEHDRR